MIFRSIIILIIIIISGIGVSAETVENYTLESKNIEWMEIEDKTIVNFDIPSDIDTTEYQSIMILRSDIKLEVLSGDKTLIKVEPSVDGKTKTTGKGWTVVPVLEEYIGERITIVMDNVYENVNGTVKFYTGENRRVLWTILKESIIDIFVCTILVFIAVTLFIVGRLEIGGSGKERGIFYLGYLAISIFMWRVGKINILRLFIEGDNMWSNIGYIGLSFMPITFSMHLAMVFNQAESRIIDAFCKINLGIIVIQLVGHITGVFEYKESLYVTYLLITCILGVVGYIYYKEGIKYRSSKDSIIIKSIGVFMLLVGVGAVLYKITGNDAGIPALGALIYICILTIDRVRNIRTRSIKNSQIDVYKKLAFVDEMTGLYNRTALEYDFNNYNENIKDITTNLSSLAIVVVDLNNLKFCNDKYGHDKGDMYIKTVSNAILEAFCENCKCYRMGGDEFCIIYENATLEDIEDKFKYMRIQVDKVNKRNTVFKYNYALGYEWYDNNLDKVLQDTMKRADEKMYQTKRLMKNLGR